MPARSQHAAFINVYLANDKGLVACSHSRVVHAQDTLGAKATPGTLNGRPGREDPEPWGGPQAQSGYPQWCMSCQQQKCRTPSTLLLPGALALGAAPVQNTLTCAKPAWVCETNIWQWKATSSEKFNWFTLCLLMFGLVEVGRL